MEKNLEFCFPFKESQRSSFEFEGGDFERD